MRKRIWTWVGLATSMAAIGGCSLVEKATYEVEMANQKLQGVNAGVDTVTTGVHAINDAIQNKPTDEAQQSLEDSAESSMEPQEPDDGSTPEDTVGNPP